MDALVLLLAGILATATAVAVDFAGEKRGLTPPGFTSPARRLLANFLLTAVLFGIFLPLLSPKDTNPDLSAIGLPEIFGFQIILLFSLATWYALGYAKLPPEKVETVVPGDTPEFFSDFDETPFSAPVNAETVAETVDETVDEETRQEETLQEETLQEETLQEETRQEDSRIVTRPWSPPRTVSRGMILQRLGLACSRIDREISVGLVAGFGAWLLVLVTTALLAVLLQQIGLGEAAGLEQDPSPLIAWLAAQPIIIRCLISLAAGVSEELFFRGFLQPRLGVGLSTALFVAGHAGYGQPMMLVGITLLSLFYAKLFSWRGNVWAAMVAHTLFDAIQLLVVIPAALQALEGGPIGG